MNSSNQPSVSYFYWFSVLKTAFWGMFYFNWYLSRHFSRFLPWSLWTWIYVTCRISTAQMKWCIPKPMWLAEASRNRLNAWNGGFHEGNQVSQEVMGLMYSLSRWAAGTQHLWSSGHSSFQQIQRDGMWAWASSRGHPSASTSKGRLNPSGLNHMICHVI